MIRQFELTEKVKAYDPHADIEALNSAYVFAMKAHGNQRRESGDAYFSHPLEVAGILADMHLDCDTIITALLHDTVEDTSATLDQIRELFGNNIATLVDGVTKLTRIQLQSPSTKQAENFRKLVLAMSNDIRVLLVKLIDRLHNMRTIHHIKNPEKQQRIARETLEIFAPLAERIGMHDLKDELEDLAFKILHPDGHESVVNRFRYLEQKEGKKIIDRTIGELKKLLEENHIPAKVIGRIKRPYSIWLKMRLLKVSIERPSDIIAFRIITETRQQCYEALGVVHAKYQMIPGRFKDYISTPKPNNYQSIHTTVMGPFNERVEIQIRTEEMHRIAEYGVAAHWQYKQGENRDLKDYQWLRNLLEILEQASGPEEFLEQTKLEMFHDQVFCFTPTGDLLSLPSGSTPLDFAYAIHSEVGNHCVAAKVNGRMVPLRSVLRNGDQVEITTSKSQTPSPTWERFVVTARARANIRKYIRNEKRDLYIDLGRSLLKKAYQQEHLQLSENKLETILNKFACHSVEDLYALVGEGQHTSHDILRATDPEFVSKKESFEPPLPMLPPKEEKSVSIQGLIPGLDVHYAGCCHPLPGDNIVGIVVTGRGVTVHTYDCENLDRLTGEPERWIDIAWGKPGTSNETFIGRLDLVVQNEPGTLANLATIIGRNGANIVNLKFTNRTETFFDMLIDLEVKDVEHLTNILAALRTSPLVVSAERNRG